jgi:hypothetical protein
MSANPPCHVVLAAHWRSTTSGPFFDLADPPAELLSVLPPAYLSAVAEFGGREGFLGETYLRLYRLRELIAINLAYDVLTLLPEFILFGSNGGGEAFAFAIGEPAVVQVPFIPLQADHAERLGANFTEFVRSLPTQVHSLACRPEAVGMEVHDVNPICFGGNPNDPANKVLVPVRKHVELCRFWNRTYRDVLARQRGSA